MLASGVVPPDPTTGLATLSAQATCYDPHSGIAKANAVMNVGTYGGGRDVASVAVTPTFATDYRLEPGVVKGSVSFTGVQGAPSDAVGLCFCFRSTYVCWAGVASRRPVLRVVCYDQRR